MIKQLINKLKTINIFFYFYFKYKKKKVLFLDEKEKEIIYKNIPEGINKTERNDNIIVSLTTFPARINEVYFSIYSVLNQTCKPDKVVLWLTIEEFPDGEKCLPEKLLYLKNFGLEIKWCDNLRSYNKLLPTLKIFPDSIIITIDDDIYYDEKMIERLYTSYKKYAYNSKNIFCHRAHKIKISENGDVLPYSEWCKSIDGENISYNNLLTGVGGVLYPPGVLYKDISATDLIKKLCPTADDIWFWAMGVLNNTKIVVVKNNNSNLKYVNLEKQLKNIDSLEKINVINNQNNKQLRRILKKYPSILNILNKGRD